MQLLYKQAGEYYCFVIHENYLMLHFFCGIGRASGLDIDI